MKYFEVFKRTFQEFGEIKAMRLAAALAYYTIFSLAPLLLIAIAIASIFFGRAEAQAVVTSQLQKFTGTTGASAIQQMLAHQSVHGSSPRALIIGFVTLFFGAAGVFIQLKDALNTVWSVPESRISSGITGFIKTRILAFGMVLGIGFLLLVSLVVDSIISSIGKYAVGALPGGAGIWEAIELIASAVVVAFLFACMFRFLPDRRIEWRDVAFGAGFTAILFVAGKFLLALYLGRSSIGSGFGAAGSLIVLLVWTYWSSAIFLLGAEFTHVFARTHGSYSGVQGLGEAFA